MWQIRNWNDHFETAQTRPYKCLRWVPFPNKHDGDGFTQLIEHEHGVMHYGLWALLVQVASKCKPRGTLVRDGMVPHTAESLGRMTRVSPKVFREAIPRFIEIGWLEDVSDSVLSARPQQAEENLIKNGMERNGTERNIRSFVAADHLEVWPDAQRLANATARKLWPQATRLPKPVDQQLLLRVAFLARTIFTDEWLADGVGGATGPKVKNRGAYLKTILTETARKRGHDLHELLDSIEIPEKRAAASANDKNAPHTSANSENAPHELAKQIGKMPIH